MAAAFGFSPVPSDRLCLRPRSLRVACAAIGRMCSENPLKFAHKKCLILRALTSRIEMFRSHYIPNTSNAVRGAIYARRPCTITRDRVCFCILIDRLGAKSCPLENRPSP